MPISVKNIIVGELATNCYLLESGIIIDPGAEPEKIIVEIEKNDFEPSKIILTHSHFDHIAAVPNLVERYGIPVIAHVKAKTLLNNPDMNLSSFFGLPISINVDHFITDGQEIEAGNSTLTIIHTPGHSSCSISLYNQDFLFSGDTLFADGFGRFDLPGSDPAALKNSLEKLLSLPKKTLIFPGHGRSSTISKAREHLYNFLR